MKTKKKSNEQVAKEYRALFDAFLRVGFNTEQSFTLLTLSIKKP